MTHAPEKKPAAENGVDLWRLHHCLAPVFGAGSS